MIFDTKYIRSNITIETEKIGLKSFFIHNYQGVCYRVFDSLEMANKFSAGVNVPWVFECETEAELELHFARNSI
jgi:hypothetical protein